MRALTGERAKRSTSPARAGHGVAALGGAAITRSCSSLIDVWTPVPTLTTRPVPRVVARTTASTASSVATKSRVCFPVPWISAGIPARRAAANAATTPADGRWRVP